MKNEERRKVFTAKAIQRDGVFRSYGTVICPNGECRLADEKFSNETFPQTKWTELWKDVADDELALTADCIGGRLVFKVVYRPAIITVAQVKTAKQLQVSIRSEYAHEIDWSSGYQWQYDPSCAAGWDLERSPARSVNELVAQVKVINDWLQNLTGTEDHPQGEILPNPTGNWLLLKNGPYEVLSAVPLDGAAVERFAQLARDFACHYAVIRERRARRDRFVPLYEECRPVVEQTEGCRLIDVGADGFCVIGENSCEVYGLRQEDFEAFRRNYIHS